MQTTDSLRYIIALPLLPEVGIRVAKHLVEHFGSAEAVFRASATDWQSVNNIRRDTIAAIMSARGKALERADKELNFISRHGIKTYYLFDSDYPYRLRECIDAPLLLYSKGNINLNGGHFLSVVGTRMPSDRGKDICTTIVKELAKKTESLTIVSGLAYGIDVTSHKAAIEVGIPTIIIPGHGLDRIYPAVHRKVAIEALTQGGILTEYMSGTQPDRQNFVARNRIIAGLSDATLVVESKQKGGSLITADMANGYSREVFAIPGRISDAQSAGCNGLIKNQKAQLVESADDIIAYMQWEKNTSNIPLQTEIFDHFTAQEQALMDILRQAEDGVHVNLLTMETARPYSEVCSTLMMLEISGAVRALPGGIYKALK